MEQRKLHIVPCELKFANEFIEKHHRHHKRVQGHRFSIACADDDGVIHGVATVGRPVSFILDMEKSMCEVTRLCTDGCPNACSILYASAARIVKELGYKKIITYILESESGDSLKATGWKYVRPAGGGSWNSNVRVREDKHPLEKKQLWERVF